MLTKKITLATFILLSLTACHSSGGNSQFRANDIRVELTPEESGQQLSKLKKDLSNAQNAQAKAEKALADAQMNKSATQQELSKLKNDLSNAQKAQAKAEKALANAQMNKSATQQELSKLKNDLSNAQKAQAKAEKALTDAQMNKSATQQELSKLKNDLSNAQKAQAKAEKALADAQMNKSATQQELSKLKNDLQTAKKQLTNTDTKYFGQKTELATIKSLFTRLIAQTKLKPNEKTTVKSSPLYDGTLKKEQELTVDKDGTLKLLKIYTHYSKDPSFYVVGTHTTIWGSNGSINEDFVLGDLSNDSSRVRQLPTTGTATYQGKAFHKDILGDFNYSVNFAEKTGEGKISHFTNQNWADIDLKKAPFTNNEYFVGDATQGSSQGKYQLGLFRNTNRIGGGVFIEGSLPGATQGNADTPTIYGIKGQGVEFAVFGDKVETSNPATTK